MRSAQLSIGTIGIAIIVLVTVAIVIGVATGYFGKWTGQAGEVTGKTCEDADPVGVDGDLRSECLSGENPLSGYFTDAKAGQVCCK